LCRGGRRWTCGCAVACSTIASSSVPCARRQPATLNELGGTPNRRLKDREKSDDEAKPQAIATAVSDGGRGCERIPRAFSRRSRCTKSAGVEPMSAWNTRWKWNGESRQRRPQGPPEATEHNATPREGDRPASLPQDCQALLVSREVDQGMVARQRLRAATALPMRAGGGWEHMKLSKPQHDPAVCGLDKPGPGALCPGCRELPIEGNGHATDHAEANGQTIAPDAGPPIYDGPPVPIRHVSGSDVPANVPPAARATGRRREART
jgi:hypothetical protein